MSHGSHAISHPVGVVRVAGHIHGVNMGALLAMACRTTTLILRSTSKGRIICTVRVVVQTTEPNERVAYNHSPDNDEKAVEGIGGDGGRNAEDM